MVAIIVHWQTIAVSLGTLLGAVVLGLLANTIVFAFVHRLARQGNTLYGSIRKHCYGPMRLLLPVGAVDIVTPFIRLREAESAALQHALALALIGGIGWLSVRVIAVAGDEILTRYQVADRGDVAARKIYTQVSMFRRAIGIVVGVLTFSVMIMTFSWARELGTSLLASAGIAGLVVGMAARSTLSNLIAGIQIALTEPIRIEDVVIVEGQWGNIEEITTTYVVVRIWDLRRLVLPISYFIEKPFQNWTRVTADLLGTVFLYTDYTVPVDAVREELHRILKSTDMWDGKAWVLQVTNATEHTMELRALMSSSDSPTSWNLRCLVREKLITFLQQNYPESLPRTRVEMERGDSKTPLPSPGTAPAGEAQ